MTEHSREWDPDRALEDLTQEIKIDGDDNARIAKRLMHENLPIAAMAICHVAQYADNDRLRLDAAKYIVERNLGRTADVIPPDSEDPLEKLLDGVIIEVTS